MAPTQKPGSLDNLHGDDEESLNAISEVNTLTALPKARAATAPTASSALSSLSTLKQQVERLRSHNYRLQAEHQKENQKLESKIQQAEEKTRELVKGKSGLQSEMTVLQKENRLLTKRESALRAALEKSETTARTFADKSSKYMVLQKKLDDIERVHHDSKKRQQAQVEELQKAREAALKRPLDRELEVGVGPQPLEPQAEEPTREQDLNSLQPKIQRMEQEKAPFSEDRQQDGRLAARDRTIRELAAALADEKRNRKETENMLLEFQTNSKANMKECCVRTQNMEQEAIQNLRVIQALQQTIEEMGSERLVLVGELERSKKRLADAKGTIATTSVAYGHLASNAVPLTTHRRVKLDNAQLKLHVAHLDRKLGDSEAQVEELATLVRQSSECRSQIEEVSQQAQSQAEEYSAMLRQRKEEERTTMAAVLKTHHDDVTLRDLFNGFLSESHRDLACSHQVQTALDSLLVRLYGDAARQASSSLCTLSELTGEATSAWRASDAKASSLEKTCLALQDELRTLQTSSETLGSQLTARDGEVSQLKDEHTRLKRAQVAVEHGLRRDVVTAEAGRAAEMERAKGLEAKLGLNAIHEEALRADYNHLAAQFDELGRYEEAYKSLMHQVDLLVSRNALAEDEAERLSQINSEILSHTNPNQRILYVDRIRRELADVKQQLVALTCDRDSALSANRDLQAELVMYKSVTPSADGRPRTTMTRLQRVPLGSRTNVFTNGRPRAKSTFSNPRNDSQTDGLMTLDEII